jgi:hypothetical protein
VQSESISTECIGGDDIGARMDVRTVDVANEVGSGEVHFVVRTIDEHATVVDFSAHGTIEQDDLLVQGVAKVLHERVA